MLANSAYLSRHNQVAKIIHSTLAQNSNLIQSTAPYYKYTPFPVLENQSALLYWDRPVITDKTVDYNRPDILLIDKNKRKSYITDIAVPLTANVIRTEYTKAEKHQNLAIEIKNIWKLSEVCIIPVAVSVEGAVSVNLHYHLEKIKVPAHFIAVMQKAAILQTCHIVRKFFAIG
ncbi:unnamed protein product [Acanthoscelides obtectus]|uniref:Uncharacterized protein n=1 Tax=Acanthoscelides obtectus TaxID=200917 RepID=A0A9P0MAQ3_ACAOB|nr:unnamed protein product [Acanthoscelides obtectus]CAK1639325.1 hypothetical protein AOBTE_LOCUS11124 [Acanthoscelides obtectus]